MRWASDCSTPAFYFHHPSDGWPSREISSLLNGCFFNHFDVTAPLTEHELDCFQAILIVATVPAKVHSILDQYFVVIGLVICKVDADRSVVFERSKITLRSSATGQNRDICEKETKQ